MSTQEKVFEIVDGPNRERLVMAFLFAYEEDKIGENLCKFTINVDGQKKRILMRLYEVTHEDGSGHSFMFRGYYGSDRVMINSAGYYNAKSRKGWLKPTLK